MHFLKVHCAILSAFCWHLICICEYITIVAIKSIVSSDWTSCHIVNVLFQNYHGILDVGPWSKAKTAQYGSEHLQNECLFQCIAYFERLSSTQGCCQETNPRATVFGRVYNYAHWKCQATDSEARLPTHCRIIWLVKFRIILFWMKSKTLIITLLLCHNSVMFGWLWTYH